MSSSSSAFNFNLSNKSNNAPLPIGAFGGFSPSDKQNTPFTNSSSAPPSFGFSKPGDFGTNQNVPVFPTQSNFGKPDSTSLKFSVPSQATPSSADTGLFGVPPPGGVKPLVSEPSSAFNIPPPSRLPHRAGKKGVSAVWLGTSSQLATFNSSSR